MRRQSGYTLLNLIGLVVGMSASLLIVLYLTQQLTFDMQHEHADRIFRISSDFKEADNAFRWSVTQWPLATELETKYPEVERSVRFQERGRTEVSLDDKTFFIEDVFIVDTSAFEVFTFDFIHGDPETALKEPNSLIINRTEAERIFGTANVVGKTLTIDQAVDMKITAVYEDMPRESHLIANAFTSAVDLGENQQGGWGGFYLYTYVLLKEGVNPADFEAKLPQVDEEHVATIFEQFGVDVTYEMLALQDIHLTSTFEGEPEPVGSMEYIYIFAAIGVFLLLIACINYMNLATARSMRRAREVGVRKVMGAWRGQLIAQFLAESILLAIIALTVSLVVVYISLPFFNNILDLPLEFSAMFQGSVLWAMFGLLVFTGLLAGSYPAFFLSSFSPATVLKSANGKTTGGNRRLRQGLVVLQFGISMFMLVSTGIISDQLNYLSKKDLGYTNSPVIRFQINVQSDREKWPVLREKLLNLAGVEAAATTGSAPGQGYGKNLMPIETADGSMEEKGLDQYFVDYEYFSTMEMEVVTGRAFDRSRSLDSAQAVMVNEAMVARMGWDDPIGKKVQFGLGDDNIRISQVIGVVRDFHHNSLYDEINPLLFMPAYNLRTGVVRISPENVERTLSQVETAWQEVYPLIPFEYVFQDEEFFEQYQADQHRSQLFTLFSILTIVIACLGLLGLASFTAEQRTRELGIRKIVGASIPQLIQLLTREFLILVLIAAPIAFVGAGYFMSGWLDDFAYHTDLNWVTFLISLIVTLAITLAATGYHAWRAATINPATALRYE